MEKRKHHPLGSRVVLWERCHRVELVVVMVLALVIVSLIAMLGSLLLLHCQSANGLSHSLLRNGLESFAFPSMMLHRHSDEEGANVQAWDSQQQQQHDDDDIRPLDQRYKHQRNQADIRGLNHHLFLSQPRRLAFPKMPQDEFLDLANLVSPSLENYRRRAEKLDWVPLMRLVQFYSQSLLRPDHDDDFLDYLEQELFDWFNHADGEYVSLRTRSQRWRNHGIVLTGGYHQLVTLLPLIIGLRKVVNTTLPIEVVYMNDSDLPPSSQKLIKDLGLPHVTLIDASTVFNFTKYRIDNFCSKMVALFACSFEHAIFLVRFFLLLKIGNSSHVFKQLTYPLAIA